MPLRRQTATADGGAAATGSAPSIRLQRPRRPALRARSAAPPHRLRGSTQPRSARDGARSRCTRSRLAVTAPGPGTMLSAPPSLAAHADPRLGKPIGLGAAESFTDQPRNTRAPTFRKLCLSPELHRDMCEPEIAKGLAGRFKPEALLKGDQIGLGGQRRRGYYFCRAIILSLIWL
jgi:hypothetical protein